MNLFNCNGAFRNYITELTQLIFGKQFSNSQISNSSDSSDSDEIKDNIILNDNNQDELK